VTLPKDDPFVIKTIQTDISKIAHQSTISMKDSSQDPAYYDVTMTYFLPAKDVPSKDE